MESNDKPLISGKSDDTAALRRIIDVPFRSCFVSDPSDSLYTGLDYIFQGDIKFKSNQFKKMHRYALFYILLDYWKDYQYKCNYNIDLLMCNSIRERTNEYLASCNEIKCWFDENYTLDPSDNTKIIKLKDAYNLFKTSDYWINKSKFEKRELNYNKFVDNIMKSIFFKRYYKEIEYRKDVLEKYSTNCDKIRNILTNFELIVQSDSNSTDLLLD